jgi:hypothetical protein
VLAVLTGCPTTSLPVTHHAYTPECCLPGVAACTLCVLAANPSQSDTIHIQVILMLSELSPKDAANEMHETVYEYQEWSVLSDWQPMAQPGRYSGLWCGVS